MRPSPVSRPRRAMMAARKNWHRCVHRYGGSRAHFRLTRFAQPVFSDVARVMVTCNRGTGNIRHRLPRSLHDRQARECQMV